MNLDELRAFLAVTDAGSLTAAARRTGIPRTTLRRRVQSLEERLKSPLFTVEGASMRLTARGHALVAHARALIAQAEQMQAAFLGTSEASETVLVALVQSGIPPQVALTVLTMLHTEYPGLAVDLQVRHDPLASLVHEGDFAVAVASSRPEDRAWVSRRVATLPVQLWASRDYLDRRGRPTSLADLASHDVMTYTMVADGHSLPLRGGGTVPVTPRASSNDLHYCAEAARLGFAVALAPPPMAAGEPRSPVEQPELLLEDLVGAELAVRIVAPGGLSVRPTVAAALDSILAVAAQTDLLS